MNTYVKVQIILSYEITSNTFLVMGISGLIFLVTYIKESCGCPQQTRQSMDILSGIAAHTKPGACRKSYKYKISFY